MAGFQVGAVNCLPWDLFLMGVFFCGLYHGIHHYIQHGGIIPLLNYISWVPINMGLRRYPLLNHHSRENMFFWNCFFFLSHRVEQANPVVTLRSVYTP